MHSWGAQVLKCSALHRCCTPDKQLPRKCSYSIQLSIAHGLNCWFYVYFNQGLFVCIIGLLANCRRVVHGSTSSETFFSPSYLSHTSCLIFGSPSLELVCDRFLSSLLGLCLMNCFHENAFILENISFALQIHFVIRVLIYLLCLTVPAVWGKHFSQMRLKISLGSGKFEYALSLRITYFFRSRRRTRWRRSQRILVCRRASRVPLRLPVCAIQEVIAGETDYCWSAVKLDEGTKIKSSEWLCSPYPVCRPSRLAARPRSVRAREWIWKATRV